MISTFPLYGFGHLITNSDKALKLQEENNKLLSKLIPENKVTDNPDKTKEGLSYFTNNLV
jgi:hypothetical protein